MTIENPHVGLMNEQLGISNEVVSFLQNLKEKQMLSLQDSSIHPLKRLSQAQFVFHNEKVKFTNFAKKLIKENPAIKQQMVERFIGAIFISNHPGIVEDFYKDPNPKIREFMILNTINWSNVDRRTVDELLDDNSEKVKIALAKHWLFTLSFPKKVHRFILDKNPSIRKIAAKSPFIAHSNPKAFASLYTDSSEPVRTELVKNIYAALIMPEQAKKLRFDPSKKVRDAFHNSEISKMLL